MSDTLSELDELGQRVLDAILQTYDPQGNASLALALHPGQPMPDQLVQNGVTNPLRLSEWIEEQYDYPLLLELAGKSNVVMTGAGATTAKAAYVAMVPWALPSVPADSPAWARINALIGDARKELGDNPEALPFSCEPTDFAQQDCTAWKEFDTTITDTTRQTTTETPPAAPSRGLWKVQGLSSATVAALTQRAQVRETQSAERLQLIRQPRIDALVRTQAVASTAEVPVRTLTLAKPVVANLAVSHRMADMVRLAPAEAEQTASAPPIVARRIAPLACVNADDFAAQSALASAPTSVTTTGSELHVHFEYCLVSITRSLSGRNWWRQDLLREDDWYVPGMQRGDMVAKPPDDAHAWCLPQGLLLVRNFICTGTWTSESLETFKLPVSYLGPFLLHPETSASVSASSSTTVTVTGPGPQVIGEVCVPLGTLPPKGDQAVTG